MRLIQTISTTGTKPSSEGRRYQTQQAVRLQVSWAAILMRICEQVRLFCTRHSQLLAIVLALTGARSDKRASSGRDSMARAPYIRTDCEAGAKGGARRI